jgi:hypothetical protein
MAPSRLRRSSESSNLRTAVVPSTDRRRGANPLANRTLRRYSLASTMAKALMIGGVFLLARGPRGLAQWYQRHLGWELGYLADERAPTTSSCTTAKSIDPTKTSTWCSRPSSPAMVADGNRARVDGFVSLGVVARAIVVSLGAEIGDPIIGPLIDIP